MAKKTVRTTSARKPGHTPGPKLNPSLIAILAVAAAVIVIMFFASGHEEPEPVPTPAPTASQAPAAPTSSPTPASLFDPLLMETPTPTPEIWRDEAGGREESCIAFKWTAGLQPGVEGPTTVQVDLENNCDHELSSLNLVFEARGFRDGEIIERVQSNFGGALQAGATQQLELTLPAVPGGYDRVDLQPLE